MSQVQIVELVFHMGIPASTFNAAAAGLPDGDIIVIDP